MKEWKNDCKGLYKQQVEYCSWFSWVTSEKLLRVPLFQILLAVSSWAKNKEHALKYFFQWWVCSFQMTTHYIIKDRLSTLLENFKSKHIRFYVLLINIDILLWKTWKYVSLRVSSLCYGTHSAFVVCYILQSGVTVNTILRRWFKYQKEQKKCSPVLA